MHSSARDVQRAVRRLFATGWFKDIKPWVTEGDSGRISVELEVEEWPYATSIEFHGLEHVRSSTIPDRRTFEPPRPSRRRRKSTLRAHTRRLLAKEGFQLRSIEIREEPIRQNDIRVVVNAQEGSRVALADVVFEGNTAFTTDELKGALNTREEGFLGCTPARSTKKNPQ